MSDFSGWSDTRVGGELTGTFQSRRNTRDPLSDYLQY